MSAADLSRESFLLLKQRLLEVGEQVTDASLLLPVGFQLRHRELYNEALEAFGSWEAVLAELVVIMRDKELILNPPEEPTATTRQDTIAIPNREAAPEASEPIIAITTNGTVAALTTEDLPLTHTPQALELDDTAGSLQTAAHLGKENDLFLFSQSGLYFGLLRDFIPNGDALKTGTMQTTRFDMPEGDSIFAALSRRQIEQKGARFLHVTRNGKAKASALSEYSQQYGKQGREAFLLKDDDVPLTVLVGKEYTGLFCASAQGQGIHMDASDIRTMGRKSVGVNVMKLAGSDDEVISAFFTEGVEELAVITQQGYAKRIDFHEFRRQGRGGSGMQVLRLNAGDLVVGVVPLMSQEDLLVTTMMGQVWRLPSALFPIMGRAARGKRILEMDDDLMIGLSVLPCAGNPPEETPAQETPAEETEKKERH